MDNKKDGSRGAPRMRYGSNDTSAERAWIWKFIDAGKTAGDLYGRALVVIAAKHYASRLVLPNSQQHQPLAWGSRQVKAVKALEKLAGPHLPMSLKQPQKAVAKAKTEYDQQLSDALAAARNARAEAHGAEHVDNVGDDLEDGLAGQEFDDDLDNFED